MLVEAREHSVDVGASQVRTSLGVGQLGQLAALRALQDRLEVEHQLLPDPFDLGPLAVVGLNFKVPSSGVSFPSYG